MRKRSEETREAILAVARHQFLNNGYIGATVDLMAARAGVTKRTVYISDLAVMASNWGWDN